MIIFPQRENELRRRCTRGVNQNRAATAEIEVAVVEREPVSRGPKIGGRITENWSGMEANNCFALPECAARAGGVAGNDKCVRSIAGHATMAPNSTFNCGGRPGCYARRIVDRYADHPAVIRPAIAVQPRIGHINYAIHEAESSSLILL